jgi:protein-S-isoprenylcysteine O-methyltransferase Ste14
MEKKILVFGIAGISLIGIILLLTTEFAGFYLTGYYSGYRYSCLTCDYATPGDRIAIISGILLLSIQLVIAINAILPTPFLKKDLMGIIFVFGILTIVVMIIGLIAFAITYGEFEWWVETGFWGGVGAGLINTVLGLLIKKSR